MSFQKAFHKVIAGDSLTADETRQAFCEMMDGVVSPVQMGGFLSALRVKGETVQELTGAAEAMRDSGLRLESSSPLILDCCGTGGDGQSSFNVSSAVACVVAGAGYTVAKHGNRSVSSKSGSADVFEACGVSLDCKAPQLANILEQNGLAFLYAPYFHPAMKHATPVRRELGIRTIFNLLGPITNPARPQVQLVGVYAPEWVEPMADTLVALGCREGVVVHGHGHDELVISGPNHVALIENGVVRLTTWTAADFGLQENPIALIPGATAKENAAMLITLLQGQPGVLQDVVCMNAAALIQAASRIERHGKAYSLKEAFEVAKNSILRGHALMKLNRLKELSQRRVSA